MMGNNKIVSLLFAILIFSTIASAQPQPPDTLWTRTYGGSGDDRGYDLEIFETENLLFLGSTQLLGSNNTDILLLKTDLNGDTLWTRTFGGNQNDVGKCVKVTNNRDIIIAGKTSSFGQGGSDVYLIKTDINGIEEWTKTYGGCQNDQAQYLQICPDGGFIVVGMSYSYGTGNSDVYLLRLNDLGDTLWTRTYGGMEYDAGYSVELTNDGGYIIAGETGEFESSDVSDILLLKVNSEGDTLWRREFGGQLYDGSYSVVQSSNGGFVIGGTTASFGTGEKDIYIIKVDENGSILWEQTIGDIGSEVCAKAIETASSDIVFVGHSSSNGNGAYDIYLVKTDSIGNLLWEQKYGGIDEERGWGVEELEDGGFAIVGRTKSFGNGEYDVYMIRTNGKYMVEFNDILQILFPSKVVFINYNLFHTENSSSMVTLQISSDGGLTWNVPATHAWGNIGPDITPGTGKTIYWNAGLDYPNQFNQNMRIKIIADDGE